MNRSEFLKTLGTGSVAVCAACGMISCSDDSVEPAPTGSLDITINIEESPYVSLKNVGGSVIKDDLIIARTGTDTFVALSKSCTHAGVTVNYDHSDSKFLCSPPQGHGSQFATNGTVIEGPANRPLTKYKTAFSSPNLRIFS